MQNRGFMIGGKKGFTLVEMLVVLAIFGTAMVVASDIFLRVSDTGRRVELLNRMQGDVRFALERIAQDVRLGRIDYDTYEGPIPAPATTLYLRDAQGNAVSFSFAGGELNITASGKTAALLSDNVTVESGSFYVSPASNPFARDASGKFLADAEPRVTMQLKIAGTGLLAHTKFDVQTTVSSRYYAR